MAKEASAEQIAHAVVNVIDDEFIRVSWGKIATAGAAVFVAGAISGVKLHKRFVRWNFERKYGKIEV